MKIGILTITDYNNYGNRLQNYALQEVLKKKNHEVVSIKNTFNKKKTFKEKISNITSFDDLIKKIKKRILLDKNKIELNNLRFQNFMEFNDIYIRESDFEIKEIKNIPDKALDFDLYVIGSDQVWNYEFDRFSKLDFASFSKSNQKVISYAASFGVNDIPKNKEKIYKEGLKNIDIISVREERGADIVKKMINEKAKVVLDPTMLLTKEEWLELPIETYAQEKYIVTYFLGEMPDERKSYIEHIAEEKGCKIKHINNISDEKSWILSPIGFLELIYNAESVYTDSYHACVFSIIFEKHFEVFDRKSNHSSMNSRIETLLRKFDLEKQKKVDGFIDYNKTQKIDYSSVNEILRMNRKESLSFLDKSLS
ncbi:hypothetical protein VL4N_17300 [Vagococcus lutrae]|uniref:polysaccharide pyruvyl transferase family protein n=1 Tax=Vagococcus lutrae TaxID=81947 RepID=UPI0019271987|nr:polysaccharide pyruvyl transferase family protein [Vagococcus lutrae]GEQ62383.1 hypothetical protein VL2N_17190 [Vagococcus lutrae]GEQ64289.1 hypothetical protein VL3N_17310 [Vagococcus lutrae]GEQ66180.1 hypothetical protein VL4N_17300 [Vagococcus lutrae]